MGRRTLGSLIVAGSLVLSATALSAQSVKVGGQLSFGDDTDFGVGPRVAFELPGVASGLWIAGSFDYFFPDQGLSDPGGSRSAGDVDYWEFNANLLYDIQLTSATNVAPYVGAGLNLARRSFTTESSGTSSSSDLGLNIVGGLNFPLNGVTPFVEARIEVSGGEQIVVAGGILFP